MIEELACIYVWAAKYYRGSPMLVTQSCFVFRLPEIPADTEATNPILKRFDSPGFVEFSRISQQNAYFGLGKALLEFETAVGEFERKCEGK